MQEIIRRLFRQTFLLERKYDKKAGRMVADKDFYFVDRHMEFLTDYFAAAGIRLEMNSELGTIYLTGETTMGERIPKLATIYLLLLKLIYDEQMAAVSSSVNILTTFGELNGKVGEFRLSRSLSSLTEIRRAFAFLKKYQMIELMDTLDELGEHTRILIYPCINLVLMREDILKLLQSFGEEEEGREVFREAEEDGYGTDEEDSLEGEKADGDTADSDSTASVSGDGAGEDAAYGEQPPVL
nr:DUF4194 domain-containing protein [uncultured Eisenbergiella sp.]